MVSFPNNVFVNCPLDTDYLPLLRPLLFTIVYLDFKPRLAPESADSSEPRINKIIKLIEESKYAIHDLSRLISDDKGEYYRLNMPFELGLDIGCKLYHGTKWQEKKCLILEKEKHRLKVALSDLSNSDILDHNNDPEIIVRQVRHWLVNECGAKDISPKKIWYDFNDFMTYIHDKGLDEKDIDGLFIKELLEYMRKWIDDNVDSI